MSDKWDSHDGRTHSEHSPEHHHKNATPAHAEVVNPVHTTDLPPIPKYTEPATSVHARFRLYKDARAQYWHDGGYQPAADIELAAVSGPPFGPATPQGQIKMLIANPEAIPAFRNMPLGQEYDVIFTPVKAE